MTEEMTPQQLMGALMQMEDRALANSIFQSFVRAEDVIKRQQEMIKEAGAKALAMTMLAQAVAEQVKAQPYNPAKLYATLQGRELVVYPDGSGHMKSVMASRPGGAAFNSLKGFMVALGLEEIDPVVIALDKLRGTTISLSYVGEGSTMTNSEGKLVRFSTYQELADATGLPLELLRSNFGLGMLSISKDGHVRGDYKSLDVSDFKADTLEEGAEQLRLRCVGGEYELNGEPYNEDEDGDDYDAEEARLTAEHNRIRGALGKLEGYRVEIDFDGQARKFPRGDQDAATYYANLEELAKAIDIPANALSHDSLFVIEVWRDSTKLRGKLLYRESSEHDVNPGYIEKMVNSLVENRDPEKPAEPEGFPAKMGSETLGDFLRRRYAARKDQ